MYMHPHLSSMFIQVTSIYPTLFIHIYYLHSSKCHPCINLFSSMYSMISIQNHLHSSKFESTYIHVSICVHPHLSRYSTSLIHPHYIHVSIIEWHSFIIQPLLSKFIHFPSTFSYTFIHDYLLGCHQQCSSTLFYPHRQFIYFHPLFIHITLHSCMSMYFYTIHPLYHTFCE